MSLSGSQKGYPFSKLVSVSSSNAVSGSTSDFIYTAGTTLQQINRVSIASVSFYNNIYNIYNDTRGSNNSYTYAYGAVPVTYTYTVPPGFYNVGTLLNLLNTNLTTNLGGANIVTWTLDSVTNRVNLIMTTPTAATFQLNPTPTSPTGLLTALGGGPFLQSTVFDLTASPQSILGDTFPLLSGPTQVYLRSSTLSPANSIEAGGLFANTLLAIPITAPYLALNVFECKVDNLCEISYKLPRNLSSIDIQLTDRYGNILDLHGGTLNIELRVWYNVF